MRAGCFAEDRVIDLINRRFVPFFFNRGGPGLGKDAAALAFVAGQTENQAAYLAAFRPTGELLGETELYADKDAVAAFLSDLLARYPEYAGPTPDEARLLAEQDAPEDHLASARLREELADYSAAAAAYAELSEAAAPPIRAAALLGLLRIERYRKDWPRHERHEARLRQLDDDALSIHADVERGYRLLAQERYAEARQLLQPLARRATASPRLAEAHFSAGVACWFDGDRDWAKLHWVWIVENLPEDRLAPRARIAAAAEGMPYANPELGGYRGPVGNIGTEHIVRAVDAATGVYRELLPHFEAEDYRAVRAQTAAATAAPAATQTGPGAGSESPFALVASLRDGNEFRLANNKVVDRLVAIGPAAIPSLTAAVRDEAFGGRGYAAWALGSVLRATKSRDPAALAALEEAAGADGYVGALARSGRSLLDEK